MPFSVFGLGRPSAEAPNKVGPVQAEVLRIIRDNPGSAYGAGIAQRLRERCGDEVSDAQTYIALRRLLARGFIAERDPHARTPNTPSDSRRGRPHKHYALTASGKRALHEGGDASYSKAGSDAQMEGQFHGAKGYPAPVVG
ncbi:helix-turn-helix transcriptional regulator [Aquibium microcysteis]|uniref:PadR family transcriptional regulator n=1 Tax=Aquibium microcysteis TaxID=675281 RepID=UPI00165D21EF